MVRPYLDSKFQLQGGTLLAPGVIIRPDMTFRRWLTSWMRHLTGLHASGPHAAQVLCMSSCHVVLKHLPIVETLFHCPQAFLSLGIQCRDDVSGLKQMFWD